MSEQTIPVWTLGDRLAKARRDAHISVATMAALLDVTPKTVNNYEHDRGDRVPAAVILVYADRCSVSFEWLQTGAGTLSAHNPRSVNKAA